MVDKVQLGFISAVIAGGLTVTFLPVKYVVVGALLGFVLGYYFANKGP